MAVRGRCRSPGNRARRDSGCRFSVATSPGRQWRLHVAARANPAREPRAPFRSSMRQSPGEWSRNHTVSRPGVGVLVRVILGRASRETSQVVRSQERCGLTRRVLLHDRQGGPSQGVTFRQGRRRLQGAEPLLCRTRGGPGKNARGSWHPSSGKSRLSPNLTALRSWAGLRAPWQGPG